MITEQLKRRAENICIFGLALALISMLLMWYVASFNHSIAAGVEVFHLLTAALVWGISLLHLRARRLASEEKLDLEEAERTRSESGKARLFEEDEYRSTLAQTRLQEMEKYGAPIASLIIIVLQFLMGALYLHSIWTLHDDPGAETILGINHLSELSNTAVGAFISFAVAFMTFALGKYAAGMARHRELRLLRAGAGYIISCSIVSTLLLVSYGLAYTGWLLGESIISLAIPVLMLMIAIEMFINFILDFYRPRVPGQESRPIYDSRLTGLLAEPKGLLDTFSHTLDYQFGFRVSETWFFRFLNRAIAPLVLFQLAALYLLTSIVVIQPGELAVIERWGRPRGIDMLPSLADDEIWDTLEPPLTPGIHIKLPWPVETVTRIKAERIQEIFVGAPQDDENHKPQGTEQQIVTWDKEHLKGEYKYIMPIGETISNEEALATQETETSAPTPDVMFVSGAISIQYTVGRRIPGDPDGRVRRGDLYRYLYRHRDPRKLLITLSENEIITYMAGANFWDVLIDKHAETEKELTLRLQKAVDKAGLGVEILFLSLSNVHPPAGEVGKAYQEVVSARERREAEIYTARATAAKTLASRSGETSELLNSAKGYRNERVVVSKATAERFRNQQKAYAAAPEVYLKREKSRTIEKALAEAKSITVTSPGVTAFIDDKSHSTANKVGQALLGETAKD